MTRLGWTDSYIVRRADCAVIVVDMAPWATPEDLDAVVAEIREAKGWLAERDARDGDRMTEYASDAVFEQIGKWKVEAVELHEPNAAFAYGRVIGFIEGLEAADVARSEA